MNTHVPVRLPACHMHANVYLKQEFIYTNARIFALIQTDVHAQAHAYIRTYVRTDGQTDRCTGASMSNGLLLCELKKI